jgi:hypothetical protein
VSVIAFRRWDVDATGRLLGVGYPVVWEPGPQTAQCHGTSRYAFTGMPGADAPTCSPFLAAGHPTPSSHSRCGFWAHKLPIAPCACDTDHPAHGVVGAVRMWGRYVEHEYGWRAEHAEPVAVVDLTGRLAAAYPMPRYPDLASLYAEWAPAVEGRAPGEQPVWCPPFVTWSLPPIGTVYFRPAAGAPSRPWVPLTGVRSAIWADAMIAYEAWEACIAERSSRHQSGPWQDRPERNRRPR